MTYQIETVATVGDIVHFCTDRFPNKVQKGQVYELAATYDPALDAFQPLYRCYIVGSTKTMYVRNGNIRKVLKAVK